MSESNPILPSRHVKDISGQRFGRLTVLSFAGRVPLREDTLWRCRCDCGAEKVVRRSMLRNNKVKSCGCYRRSGDHTRRHGLTDARIHSIWSNMIQRCSDPNTRSYKWYGAKGITVCSRWAESFDAFFADMGFPPTDKHTIDRRDGLKGYSPDNCRWATMKEQQRNRSTNHLITHAGLTLTLVEWSERIGIPPDRIKARISKLGWPIDRALMPGNFNYNDPAGK